MKRAIGKKAFLEKISVKNMSSSVALNHFLYNCVIKGIVAYDDLTLKEKMILNEILEGKNAIYIFDEKTKKIKHRR